MVGSLGSLVFAFQLCFFVKARGTLRLVQNFKSYLRSYWAKKLWLLCFCFLALFCLLQSLGDTRASSKLQTLVCETDDGQELWLFSFSFPALFVWQSLGYTRASAELQTLIYETNDGKELWLYVNLLSSFICANRKTSSSSSSSNFRIKGSNAILYKIISTRLFAIVVIIKLFFFLVRLTGKLIWAPFCKKAKK